MNGPLPERKEGASASAAARLLRAYREEGDTSARERLIELHMPLVESLARRHARSADYEDLFQVGCIGLIQAIDRFDPERGDELTAFAVPNIAGEISRYLRDRAGAVRLPRSVYELRPAVIRAQAQLAARLGRAPTGAELAAELDTTEQQVALALEADRASTPVALSPERELAEEVASADDAEQRVFLGEMFRDLEERERRVLYLRYVRDLSTAEMARELGLSERQVLRTSRAALDKLRAAIETPSGEQPEAPQPAAAAGRRRARPSGSPRLPRRAAEPKIPAMAASRSQVQERYLDQPYHIELVRSDAPEDGWTAHVEELPGCEAHGASPDDAARRIERAMEDWIGEALANHREVPPPRSPASHSGRLMLRMPQSLHAELARVAEREDVSLNQLITSTLAAAVGWRQDASTEPKGGSEAAQPGQAAGSAPLRKALVANIVVLAVVGLVAIVLLAIALSESL